MRPGFRQLIEAEGGQYQEGRKPFRRAQGHRTLDGAFTTTIFSSLISAIV
jgi:hypothetical protein